jgi:hypothetical protein
LETVSIGAMAADICSAELRGVLQIPAFEDLKSLWERLQEAELIAQLFSSPHWIGRV